MSSSSDTRPLGPARVKVLRADAATPAPAAHAAVLERDLAAVSEAIRGWSPEQLAAALAEGYREGREQGFAAGFAEGLEQGRTAAEHAELARRADAETALAALRRAADELRSRQVEVIARAEDDLVDAALTVAEALLTRELRTVDAATREALARALALAPPEAPAVARLHPADLAVLVEPGTAERSTTWTDPATGRTVLLVADEAVERGGCLVEAGDTRVDAQLGPALGRARAALLGLDDEEVSA